MEKEKQFEIIIPEWSFQQTVEKKLNPESIKQRAREKNKKYGKELAKKKLNPYYFTDRALQVGFNINLVIISILLILK